MVLVENHRHGGAAWCIACSSHKQRGCLRVCENAIEKCHDKNEMQSLEVRNLYIRLVFPLLYSCNVVMSDAPCTITTLLFHHVVAIRE